MHSRIFQVSLEPIEKADYIEESTYYDHWFTNSIADYVNENCDRTHDIEWLKECERGYTVGCDKYGEYFIVNSKEEYFESKFKSFKDAINKIKDCTLEEFTHGLYEIWALKSAYEERFGFYVDADGELITFDSFIRACAKGEKYYIGGTIDYHW